MLEHEDMNLSTREVARLLDMPEETIERWIRKGSLPAVEIKGQYMVREHDLKRWADMHHIVLNESPKDSRQGPEPKDISIFKAMQRGGVFYGIKGNNVKEVLEDMVRVVTLPENLDRNMLLELLLEREKLASTGIGEGIAIPHPRTMPEGILKLPIISTCFLEKEVDYNAIDAKPVFVLFMMISPSIKVHLEMLSRLSFCLRDRDFIRFLRKSPGEDDLLKRVKVMEERLKPASTTES